MRRHSPSRRQLASNLTFTARAPKLVIAVMALAFVMDLMDSTILTIALSTNQRHMHIADAELANPAL